MADDTPDVPIYRIEAASTDYRRDVRRHRREERARVLSRLHELMEESAKPTVMAMMLELEDSHAREDEDLRESWLRDVQAGYLRGRAEMADEQVRSMTGDPAADPDPLILH